MPFNYTFNSQLSVPIYRQLVDEISAAIKKGDLQDGQKLPTVQELSDMLGVARGTVKRTYDELERLGLIDKVQGRGTFVFYRSDDTGSRKERAMSAIDTLLNDLEALGFSTAEINIFLTLKMRQRAEQTANIKIAFIECNSENLSHISEQLHGIDRVELYSFLLESIEQYPYKLSEDFDLIVTTQSHVEKIEELLPIKQRVIRVALRLSPDCLSDIVKLRSGQNVGMLCYSDRFGVLLKNTCAAYTDGVIVDEPLSFSESGKIKEYLSDKNVILLPEAYEKYCSEQTLKLLKNFKGQLITCTYELDEGSFLYLREKAKRIMESKTL